MESRVVYVADWILVCDKSFVASGRLSSSKAQQEAEERIKEGIANSLKEKKELKINQAAILRNIEENVQYRKTTKDIEQSDQNILDLEKQMLAFGEKERLEAEMQRLVKQIQDLSSEVMFNHSTSVLRTHWFTILSLPEFIIWVFQVDPSDRNLVN
jgi:hypothetical protein